MTPHKEFLNMEVLKIASAPMLYDRTIYSPLMWQSKKICRVVKSAMATKTLSQVEAAEACFWPANFSLDRIWSDVCKQLNRI